MSRSESGVGARDRSGSDPVDGVVGRNKSESPRRRLCQLPGITSPPPSSRLTVQPMSPRPPFPPDLCPNVAPGSVSRANTAPNSLPRTLCQPTVRKSSLGGASARPRLGNRHSAERPPGHDRKIVAQRSVRRTTNGKTPLGGASPEPRLANRRSAERPPGRVWPIVALRSVRQATFWPASVGGASPEPRFGPVGARKAPPRGFGREIRLCRESNIRNGATNASALACLDYGGTGPCHHI